MDWLDRFWPKVKTTSENGCWLWQASTNQDGYGRFLVNGKKKQAHHVAYYIWYGEWPRYLLHSCDTPACCNPAHLREGTHQENVAECWAKGRGHKGKNYEKLDAIRLMIAAGKRNREICAALSVKNDAVSRIRHGQIYG